MARIRTIKPEFWTSEQVVECSTNARLLFVGIWNFCDDYGVHPDSAKRLKMQIFPADDFGIDDVSAMVNELVRAQLMGRFSAQDGQRFLAVTGWHHQKIDRKQPRKYPEPPHALSFDLSSNDRRSLDDHSANIGSERAANDRRAIDDHSLLEGIGEEGKGEEGKGSYALTPSASRARSPAAKDRDPDFMDWWAAYPRKKSKNDAERAWASAIKRISAERQISRAEAIAFLHGAAVEFARSADGQAGKFCPYPASWLNAGRFDDDRSTWNDRAEKSATEQMLEASQKFIEKAPDFGGLFDAGHDKRAG